ncbi:MAG: RloB family protein [Anaerolineales bacterium]|nr:RloB family protein [Anaerolineales bacterium]
MTRIPKPSGRKIRDKGHKLSRRPLNVRDLSPRFLIVCEGEQTEPNYFRCFRVNADIEIVGTGCNTLGILECAKQRRREARRRDLEYDQVWLVFDRNGFPEQDYLITIHLARQENINVAYSNEAFEIWFILHFSYLDTAVPRSQYADILTRHLGSYQKNQPDLYEKLLSCQDQAIKNADKLLNSYLPDHNPAKDNPCTTVHLLVQELNRYLR